MNLQEFRPAEAAAEQSFPNAFVSTDEGTETAAPFYCAQTTETSERGKG